MIEQKIKDNKKNDDILFDNLEEDNHKDVIQKVAEMQKHKKQFHEDNKKSSIDIENRIRKELICQENKQKKICILMKNYIRKLMMREKMIKRLLM